MALPPTLNRALAATASIVTTELFNEGKSAANSPSEYPFARINENLDGRQCALCGRVHGMILKVGTKEYAEWRQPSHIGCRRVLSYISKDVQGTEATFERPDAELIRKHGHYHVDPGKHAEYRVPAEPAGRNFIVRRVKDPTTGEVKTVLDWAPWWEQVPQWKRELVLQARGTRDGAKLTPLLEQLGITNTQDPEQLRQATLLGLKDRVEGWITFEEHTPEFVKTARQLERKITKQDKERGYVVTPEGEVLYRKVGTEDNLQFTRAEREKYFVDNILIHNHPRGTSFSIGDIGSACVHGLAEVRVVGQVWRYIMRPPEDGWSAEFWERVKIRIATFTQDLEAAQGKLIAQGLLDPAEADMLLMHQVWEQMAEEFGFNYTREKNDAPRRAGRPKTQ